MPDFDAYLTPQEAARLLGVHVVTIRRWTKSGVLEEVRTPGGHRRIPRQAVEARLRDAQPVAQADPPPPSGAVKRADSTWAQHAVVHTRHELGEHDRDRWIQAFTPEERVQSREIGQRLMGLLLRTIAGPEDDAMLWQEVGSLSRTYALIMKRAGLPLSEATRATLFFRDVLTESTAYYPSASDSPSAQVHLIRRVNKFMNEVQLVITEIYEQSVA